MAACAALPELKSVTACCAPVETDWAVCGPIACELCPATTSFTILASEFDIDGKVVVVVDVVVAMVVVVVGGPLDPRARASPTPPRTPTRMSAGIKKREEGKPFEPLGGTRRGGNASFGG